MGEESLGYIGGRFLAVGARVRRGGDRAVGVSAVHGQGAA
jgi:hypothetical protein